MRFCLALLLLAGAAMTLPGCAGSLYAYDDRPGYYDGYYLTDRHPYHYYHRGPIFRHEDHRPIFRGEVHVRDY